MFHEWRPLELQIHRIGMRGALRPLCLSLNELGIQCIGEPRYDFVLHVEQIGDGFVEAVGPKVSAASTSTSCSSPEAACRSAVCRPITNEPEMRDKFVVRLTVIPSTK